MLTPVIVINIYIEDKWNHISSLFGHKYSY